MLKRMYVNNYRCLVNFEIEFDAMTLLLGRNGSGKTSILDILYGIRRMIIFGERAGEVFSLDDMTAWVDYKRQTFELSVKDNDDLYDYRLVLEYNEKERRMQIDSESLSHNNNPLFEFMDGVVIVHYDSQPRLNYPFDPTRSALIIVADINGSDRIAWFRRWFGGLFVLGIQPKSMVATSESESPWLSIEGTNFVSWYRYISQEYQDMIPELFKNLRDSIPGFDSFRLETVGDSKRLKVGFKSEENPQKTRFFDFDRISDGERALIVLYTLIIGLKYMDITLVLDEPVNFVALAEIQPWLFELSDTCGYRDPQDHSRGIAQTIIASHHPELMDYFVVERSKFIYREPLGATRVMPPPTNFEGGLRLSQVIARGWEHE